MIAIYRFESDHIQVSTTSGGGLVSGVTQHYVWGSGSALHMIECKSLVIILTIQYADPCHFQDDNKLELFVHCLPQCELKQGALPLRAYIVFSALGFAGTMLLKGDEALQYAKQVGPSTILLKAGFPP